jgi:hypothetical protein
VRDRRRQLARPGAGRGGAQEGPEQQREPAHARIMHRIGRRGRGGLPWGARNPRGSALK